MEEYSTLHVGLDVHKDTTAIAVAGPDPGGAHFVGTVGSPVGELLKVLSAQGEPASMRIVYEAGPCGYSLVRHLRERGYRCDVIAPAKVARRAGDRFKTDRCDALHLAEQSRAGALTSVWVLDEEDEAVRDLSRAREDAVRARLKARQQLQAMLLRHGRRYSGKTRWTLAHERYPAQDLAYAEYRAAVRERHERVQRLTEALWDEAQRWRRAGLVKALTTLRGIGRVAAVTLVAELGDLRRFGHPRDLMGFLGLCHR